jgi:hypothetical protein
MFLISSVEPTDGTQFRHFHCYIGKNYIGDQGCKFLSQALIPNLAELDVSILISMKAKMSYMMKQFLTSKAKWIKL